MRTILPTLALLLLAAPSGAGTGEEAEAVFPGATLQKAIEQRVMERRSQLWQETPGHFGLIFPVSPQELRSFTGQLMLHGRAPEMVPGSAQANELHGGAVLAFLLQHWKPGGQPSRLSDAYFFPRNGREVQLREIYVSHQHQVFLPEGGGLPRMRFRKDGDETEADAYRFLAALIAREPDYAETWKNHRGQEISTDLLMRSAWTHYLGQRSPEEESRDHSNLHLVELLLGYSAVGPQRGSTTLLDPTTVQQRFLDVELRRREFEGEEGLVALAHYVESLGALLRDPRIRWNAAQRKQVRDWLTFVETEHGPAFESGPLYPLPHLLGGLWAVEANQAKLSG